MNDTTAAIISAVIGVGGSLLAMFLIHRKVRTEQRRQEEARRQFKHRQS